MSTTYTVLATSDLHANEEPGHIATQGVESHDAGHHAPIGPFYMDPTFWVALSIVVFAVLIFKTVKKMYFQATDKYAADVAKQLKQAQDLKAEAEAMIVQYREKQKQGAIECERIIQQAKTDSIAMQQSSMAELKDMIHAREQQAMEKINRLEAEIIKELRQKTANMAIDATQRILVEILDAQKNAALVDQAIREMPQKLN
ncbi:MAG: hypothetical protein EYC62_02870 [Alphaproteobacteria bacterium]|nr:MAG: hypothetical protein EYC62_02870 [Alphaproteobacteria bacterium]